MTSRKKSRILSVIFLILLSGVLIGFISTQEVNAFPEMINDSFEWDTIQTLHWNYYDTDGDGEFNIENGVLNYTASNTRVLHNDCSNVTWDDFQDADFNQLVMSPSYNLWTWNNNTIFEHYIGDNITEIDGVSKVVMDIPQYNHKPDKNSYFGVRLWLSDNSIYDVNATDYNETVAYLPSPIDNVTAYGFYVKGSETPDSWLYMNDVKIYYLVSVSDGNDQLRRELEIEEEELYIEYVIDIKALEESLFINDIYDEGVTERIFTEMNKTHYRIKIESVDTVYYDEWEETNLILNNGLWKILYEIDENKNFTLTITNVNNASDYYRFTLQESYMPRPSGFHYFEFQDWIDDDFQNNTAHIEVHYIQTYFYPSPIPRELDDEYDGLTMEANTFESLRVLTKSDADIDYIGWSVFYPDLQSLSFIWEGYSDSYPEADTVKRWFIYYFVYDDGTEDEVVNVGYHFRNSGTQQTRISLNIVGVINVNFDFATGRMDLGFSLHLEPNGQYNQKIYYSPQDDLDFTKVSESGLANAEYGDYLIEPNTNKKLIGVRVRHILAFYSVVITTNNKESKLEQYTVTYGQDIIVPETVFPQDVASTPDIGTELVPPWLLPLIFFIQLVASVFFGIIDFIFKIFVEPIANYLTSVIPILLAGLWNWILTVLAIAIETIITVLQQLTVAIITIMISLFNDIMAFFGISLTWAQFIEFILEIPSLFISFLSLGVYFFYFIDFFLSQIFIIFIIVEPFFTPFFYYFEKYWQIALLWIVLLIGAISLQQQSLDPIISLGRGLFSVVMAVVGFFRWIGELVLWFISFIAGLIRG